MKRMKNTKRRLLIFIFVTLFSGWVGAFVDAMLTEQPKGSSLGMGMWLIFPFLTGVILRVINRDWFDFGIRLNIIRQWKWYLLSL